MKKIEQPLESFYALYKLSLEFEKLCIELLEARFEDRCRLPVAA